mgnify:CR=1 FL=1
MSSRVFVFAFAFLLILSSCSPEVVTDKGSVVSAVMDETVEVLSNQSFFEFFDTSLVDYAQQSELSAEDVVEVEALVASGVSAMGNFSNSFQVAWNSYQGLDLSSGEATLYVEQWMTTEVGTAGHEVLASDAETCGTVSWLWGTMQADIGLMVYGVCCGDFVFAGSCLKLAGSLD